MSATVAVTRENIRNLIHDINDTDYAIDLDEFFVHLNAGMHEVAAEVGLGPNWEVAAITLAANDYDVTLPSTSEYQRIIQFRLTSSGEILTKVAPEEIQRMRRGSNNWPGDPLYYAIHEEDDQTVVLWVHPVQTAADSLDVMQSVIPSVLDDDADTIPFAAPLLRALEKYVASTLHSVLTIEERKRLFLGEDFGRMMMAQAMKGIRDDRKRTARFRRTDRLPMRVVPT